MLERRGYREMLGEGAEDTCDKETERSLGGMSQEG